MSLSHFQEKAGVISCETEWGSWSQNCDEITIEVKLSGKYKPKELDISISTKTLCCKVRSDVIIEVGMAVSKAYITANFKIYFTIQSAQKSS